MPVCGSSKRTIERVSREVSERQVDQALVKAVKEAGGMAPKIGMVKGYGTSGLPDRFVMLPGGVSFWVECKAPGKKPTKRQSATHAALRALGQKVYIFDKAGIVSARAFLDDVMYGMVPGHVQGAE